MNRPLEPKQQEKLAALLSLFGYFNASSDPLQLQIEPAFPVKMNGAFSDLEFFHITTKLHWEKIQRIGLTPRLSETNLNRPADRIYLLKVVKGSIPLVLTSWCKVLSRSKGKPPEEMVILRVTLDDTFPLYLDDTTLHINDKSDIRGIFTTKNIPPSYVNRYIYQS